MSEERNIYQILRNIAQNDPDHLILTDAYDDFTYSDLVQMTDSFTGVLLKKGIKPGDHVALWGTNTGNWLAAFLGIQQVGAVAVLVNYALGVDDVTALMKMTRCSALVYGGSKALLRDYHAPEKIAGALSIPADKVICALTPMINFKSLPKVTLPPLPPVDPHKSTFIIFTTGTTSLPKAVLLKQYSMLNDVDFIAKEIMQFVNPVTLMVSVPAFHCFGLIATLYGILKSKYMYLPETYEPSSLLTEVAKRNLTFLISVGTIFANIANIPGVEAMLPDCIKIAVLGGGSMTPTQFMRLESLFKSLGDEAVESKTITNAISSAQKRVEGVNFDARKTLLQYDDVLRQQREVMYDQRNFILDNEDVHSIIQQMFSRVISDTVGAYVDPESRSGELHIPELLEALNKLGFRDLITEADLKGKTAEEASALINDRAWKNYDEKIDPVRPQIRQFEREMSLKVIDRAWVNHIDTMSKLRDGIGLRSYAQDNPLQAYVSEGYQLFQNMMHDIAQEIVAYCMNLKVVVRQPDTKQA